MTGRRRGGAAQVFGSRLKSAVHIVEKNLAPPRVVVKSPYVQDLAWELKEPPVYASPLSDVIQHLHGRSASQRMGIVDPVQQAFGVTRIGREKARWSQGIAQDLYRPTRF